MAPRDPDTGQPPVLQTQARIRRRQRPADPGGATLVVVPSIFGGTVLPSARHHAPASMEHGSARLACRIQGPHPVVGFIGLLGRKDVDFSAQTDHPSFLCRS
jgi:hypothetical protein